MKKPVLKHRMLKTFSLAIGVLFVFLFLTFNLLMSFSIRREAAKDLNATAAEIKEVVHSVFPRIEAGLDGEGIAEAHGGRISCWNNGEGGAYFLLELKSYSSS